MMDYTNWWQSYMTGAAEMNKEFMRFIALRLKCDADLGQSLAKCSGWADAASVHGNWVRKTSAEYLSEAGVLMEIVSSTTRKSWTAVRDDESGIDNQSD